MHGLGAIGRVLDKALLFHWRHYHYRDTPLCGTLFVEREADVCIRSTLPEFFVFFASGFMCDILSSLSTDGARGARVSLKVEVPSWIVVLSPVRSHNSKRIRGA